MLSPTVDACNVAKVSEKVAYNTEFPNNMSTPRTLGTGTSIKNEGVKTILLPGPEDVIVIVQSKNQLHVIANGRDKIVLTPVESKNLVVKGECSKVFADKSVSLPIKGLQSVVQKLSAPAKAKIAHAKQRSTALRGMLTQQQLSAELHRDPFVEKIASQLHRIARHYGGDPFQPSTPRSPQDLVNLMTEVNRILDFQLTLQPPARTNVLEDPMQPESLSALLTGLKMSITALLTQIRTGASPDLTVLCSQMTDALHEMIQWPEAEAGKIRFERRKIPPGLDLKKAIEKSEELNQVVAEKDLSILRQFAADQDVLAIAVPVEKATLVRAFAENILNPSDEDEGGPDDELINQILQSASDAAEFKEILQHAGWRDVQKAVLESSEKTITDFNLCAGVFDAADWASVPHHAVIVMDALNQGFSRRQIIQARQKMRETRWHFSRKDDDLQKTVEKPLFMLISTVEEKADMIKQLNDGRPNKRSNRAVVTILQSTQNQREFDEVIKLAGEDKIDIKFQDEEAKKKLVALRAAYKQVLHDEAKTNRLLAGWKTASVATAETQANVSVENFVQDYRKKFQHQRQRLERLTLTESVIENLEREKNGKSLIHPQQIRDAVDSIVQNPEFSDKDRKAKIEELRKKSDLSEYTMRNLLIPLGHAYGNAADEIADFSQSRMAALNQVMSRVELRHGKNSSQANQIHDLFNRSEETIRPNLEQLQHAHNFLIEVYPLPREWFER